MQKENRSARSNDYREEKKSIICTKIPSNNNYEQPLTNCKYRMESVPTALELEEKARPYTCTDVVTC